MSKKTLNDLIAKFKVTNINNGNGDTGGSVDFSTIFPTAAPILPIMPMGNGAGSMSSQAQQPIPAVASSELNGNSDSQVASSEVPGMPATTSSNSSVTSETSSASTTPVPLTLSGMQEDLAKKLSKYEDEREVQLQVEAAAEGPNDLLQYLNKYQEERDAAAEAARNRERTRQCIIGARPTGRGGSKKKSKHLEIEVPEEIKQRVAALPITAKKDELIDIIKKNQVVIIKGDTGSGKSTQISQMIYKAGLIKPDTLIGVTQPRRVAAKSLAERVAMECGTQLGLLVGYAVRFDSNMSRATAIKFMTDGIMVKEYVQGEEPNLQEYSVVMVDEAHERSIHTDVCFGLLKMTARERNDLKIIISSATLEADKFSKFFDDAPIFEITGKGFDVAVSYLPCATSGEYEIDVLCTILRIHLNEDPGDILVFLTGQDEIEKLTEKLNDIINDPERDLPLVVVPCHGTLPFDEQQRMFEKAPPGKRKVVLATNIAETSITIEGIVYVVDCGYVKENRYNPVTKIESLKKIPITKFQAIQRKGRAGRTQPGKCFRLYSEDDYNNFTETQEPDITRSNVDSVVLDLIALGIENPMTFEFIDAPPDKAIFEALLNMRDLGALDVNLKLTPLGKQMAGFPLDPPLAKVLITSSRLGCAAEMMKIVSMLSTQYHSLFLGHKAIRAESNKIRARYHHPEGDHLALLNIFNEGLKQKPRFSEQWCRLNCIQQRYLKEADDIKYQLKNIMIYNGLLTPKGGDLNPCNPSLMVENLCKSFTAGYFYQIAKKIPHGHAYQKLNSNGQPKDVFLHPSSSLFEKRPAVPWVIFHEVMETTKPYIKGAISIKPEWVLEFAPKSFIENLEEKYYIKFTPQVTEKKK